MNVLAQGVTTGISVSSSCDSTPLTNEVLATARRISALRFGLQICYLGEGSFGVILPEAAQIDAQQVHRRSAL